MSLINDMLRDLEARRAGELGGHDLQREIRPLPDGARRWPVQVALPVLLLAGGAAAMAWWYGLPASPQPPIPPAVVAKPVPVPVPPPAESIPDPAPGTAIDTLRVATILENPPVSEPPLPANPLPPAPVVVQVVPVPPQKGLERTPEAPPKAESSVKPKAAEAAHSPPGSIEKTTVLGSARERADAEYRRAQALLSSGQAGPALDALQAALRQDPGYVPARQAQLRLLLENQHADEAMVVLQEGLDLQPGQTVWAMSLARLLVERNDLAGAEKILARSQSHATGNADYAGFQGHVLNRQGRFREAAERYLTASRLAPAEGRWWFGLGQALDGEGKPGEARDAFRRAIAAGNLNGELAALAEARAR